MRNVLILGPDFSPSGYPPALRIRFFANHLPEFGWRPTVLATHYRHYETSYDLENEKLLPQELHVVRTKALSPRWTRKFGLGDLGWRSLWYHWRTLNEIIGKAKPDLIFAPSPPSPQLLLARWAYARHGIPYVIDLIDPIVTDYYWSKPRSERPPKWPLAYAMGRFIERVALRRAGRITAVDGAYAGEALRRYGWLERDIVSGIPYGGETADVEYVREHPRANALFDSKDGYFHVLYAGRSGPDMTPAVNALFAALKRGVERQGELFRRVRLHFVGTSYSHEPKPMVVPLAEAAGVSELVTEHPARVPYLDAIQLLLDADALVALGSEEAHYTASKIFPYLMANRPLLAIFHRESSVVRILQETRAAEPVTFASVSELGEATEAVLGAWQRLLLQQHSTSNAERMQAFAPFTARAMSERLASVFDKAIMARGMAVASARANVI